MARALGVDVITCEGLAEALAGVECVIDAAAGGPSTDPEAATEFFTRSARNLHDFGMASGVQRMVVVSIIGCDRFTAGYFAHGRSTCTPRTSGRCWPVRSPCRSCGPRSSTSSSRRSSSGGRRATSATCPTCVRSSSRRARVAEALVDLATRDASVGAEVRRRAARGCRARESRTSSRWRSSWKPRARRHAHDPGRGDESDPDNALWDAGAQLPGPGARLAGPTFAEWLDITYGPVARASARRDQRAVRGYASARSGGTRRRQ